MNIFQKAKKNQKGFTLVELMVVVVIIGILVAIAIPMYNITLENAKEKQTRLILGLLRSSCCIYTEKGGQPTIDPSREGYLREEPKSPYDDNKGYIIV